MAQHPRTGDDGHEEVIGLSKGDMHAAIGTLLEDSRLVI